MSARSGSVTLSEDGVNITTVIIDSEDELELGLKQKSSDFVGGASAKSIEETDEEERTPEHRRMVTQFPGCALEDLLIAFPDQKESDFEPLDLVKTSILEVVAEPPGEPVEELGLH